MLPSQRRTLEAQVRSRPHEPALEVIDSGETLSYADFDNRVNRLANGLRERGVRPDDRIAIVLNNTIEFPISLYGCHKLGAIPVVVSTKLAEEDYGYILDRTNPQELIYCDDVCGQIEQADSDTVGHRGQIRTGESTDGDVSFKSLLATSSTGSPRAVNRRADDVSYLIFTSGTTGRPKGVRHTERSGRERASVTIMCGGISPTSTVLGMIPWYHGAGIDLTVRATITAGGTLVIVEDPTPEKTLEVIERLGVTHLISVPTLTERIASQPGVTSYDLSSIEYWMQTGAVLTKDQIEQFQSTLTPEIFNLYGSAEAGDVTQLSPTEFTEGAGSVGRPVPGSEVRIVDSDPDCPGSPNDTVPAGEYGEVIVRTTQLFDGYYDDVEKTSAVLRDGWFYTQDVGTIDDLGYLRVVGRLDDMINSGGELVSPVKVEEVLEDNPRVNRAIVVGVSDDQLGELIAAYIEADGTVSEDELDEYCQGSTRLANFERPRAYEFVDRIPLSTHGKKKRAQFRESKDFV